MGLLKPTLLIVFSIVTLSAGAQNAAPTGGKAFPAYPVPDEIVETPVMNSALMYGGLHMAAYQNTAVPALMLGLSLFLRDFFSIRAEMIIPVKKTHLDDYYAGRVSDLSRYEPVLLRAGGNLRLVKISSLYFFLPALAGIELNRNYDENSAAQMFVELGAGMQWFIDSLYFMQLEYTYHFSQIPLRSGYYLDHNFSGGSLCFGIFF